MSARAHPTAIGAFLLGALIIAVAGAALLASASWFEKRTTFVSFFSESVNGLESGAPVKFQGVLVGTVTELLIQINRTDKTFQVPVRYEVDLTRLRTLSDSYVNLADAAVRAEQIKQGLRVQLQMESLVTGQLYLEISYDTAAAPPVLETHVTEWPELPTTPSLMAALGTGAGSVVADVVKVLFQVNELLADIDMPEINAAVVATAQAVQSLVNAPEVRGALAQMPVVTAQLTRTMTSVERLAVTSEAAIAPLGAQASLITTELATSLRLLRQTLETTQGMMSMDTGIGFELQAALVSLKDAADALQLLTTTLEQNPDILLRGRKPPVRNP